MDRKLLFQINQELTGPIADKVFTVFSSLSFWEPLFAILILGLLFAGRFRGRAFLVALAVSIGVCDGLICRTLKYTVNRPRPHQVEQGLTRRALPDVKPAMLAAFHPIKQRPTKAAKQPIQGRSFPSSHSANTMTAATVAFVFFRRWWWLLYIPAGLVAYSRVYVASHWPSDIPPSLLIGLTCGFGIPYLLNLLWTRHGGRIFPKLRTVHPRLYPKNKQS